MIYFHMYINNYSRVKPENIKLKHLCIMVEHLPNQVSIVRPRFLLYHVWPM